MRMTMLHLPCHVISSCHVMNTLQVLRDNCRSQSPDRQPLCIHTAQPTFQLRLHLSAPTLLFQLQDRFSTWAKTLTDTSKNCSSLYRGKCKRLNQDCNGLESLVISLHAANTFAT